MNRDQTDGRRRNGAEPAGKPDASTPSKAVKAVGKKEQASAGPDGPDAAEVGDFAKKAP